MIIKHPHHKKGGFFMEKLLYENIRESLRRLKHKDVLFLCCGDPGNGKSTMGQQCLYVLDPSIIDSECVFDRVEDYQEYIIKMYAAGRSIGKGVMHDEAREAASTRVQEGKIKTFYDHIYENRQAHMIQCLIQSDFWKFPRDIVFNRALFMIWTVEGEQWENGHFYFYSRKKMQALYDRGKRRDGDRSPGKASFRGTFPDFYAGNPNYLEEKKRKFLEKYKKKKLGQDISVRQVIEWVLARNPDIQIKQLCQALKIEKTYYFRIRKKARSEGMGAQDPSEVIYSGQEREGVADG